MKKTLDFWTFSGGEGESDFIPVINTNEDINLGLPNLPETLPILPLRNMVLFPGVVAPITVGRDKSILLIRDAYKGNKIIGVVAQKEGSVEVPGFSDVYPVGTIALILKMLRMPDGSTTVIIQGRMRMAVTEFVAEEPYILSRYQILSDPPAPKDSKEFIALIDTIKDVAVQIIEQSPEIPSEAAIAVRNIENPEFLIHFVANNINISLPDKQKILETNGIQERSSLVLHHLNRELELLELKNKIRNKTKLDIDRQQREYFLHQQMKVLQEELGQGSNQDLEELKKKAENKKWPEAIAQHFQKELNKLERMNQHAAEYPVQLNYLHLLTDLPWNEYTPDNFNLKNAEKILDRDHFGMKKIKARILEYLAVLKLKSDMKAPILCFVGPPGVGKTSLGRSIAEALGRKYVRMALGGLKDESEIRGHRKTYVGAMPGRIIQNLKKCGSSNPVFILDELDKVGVSYQGDPASALLEVLDPEQNNSFLDNFLEVEFDLSRVMFIATANTTATIHPALRDRLEIIELSGYSTEEKVQIAKRHLLPRQIRENGLAPKQIKITDKKLAWLVEHYTHESGVRNLERILAKLARTKAREVAEFLDSKKGVEPALGFTEEDFIKALGPPHPKEKTIDNNFAGVVTGLAWTATGGEILFVETSVSGGQGKLTLTGSLGDVMKESAVIALEYFKKISPELGVPYLLFEKTNVHIHVPEGAVPKDGPSAGITMFTAIASAYTQRKVKKALAMTGEITLRGEVLPVGGIKEKLLAARRAGIKEVILSEKNKPDVEEIEPEYLRNLTFHYVKRSDEVLEIALLKEKVKKPQDFEFLLNLPSSAPGSKN